MDSASGRSGALEGDDSPPAGARDKLRFESMVKIAVISDTHGWLRDEARAVLAECDLIVHAGDLGDEDILSELREIAPTYVVRGNSDRGIWCRHLPEATEFVVDDQRCYLIHDAELLDIDPVANGIAVVFSGHTHRPEIRRSRGVLHFNPGSAGPRRSARPVTMGILNVDGTSLDPEVVSLLR